MSKCSDHDYKTKQDIINFLKASMEAETRYDREINYINAVEKALDLPNRSIEYSIIDDIHVWSDDFENQVQNVIKLIQED